MQPVLVVEGVARKIRSMNWNEDGSIKEVSYIDENGDCQFIEDVSGVFPNAKKMDLNKLVDYKGRYTPIYEAIDDYIELNQKEVQGLATVIADAASENTFVPPPKIKEREQLKQRIFGLMDAQDIVSAYMQEDVDLSGGEDIATE